MPSMHIPDKLVYRLRDLSIENPTKFIQELVRKEVERLEGLNE